MNNTANQNEFVSRFWRECLHECWIFFISGVFDLLITQVSLRDDGEFYCQVKNQSQDIIHKKRVNLTVLGKY